MSILTKNSKLFTLAIGFFAIAIPVVFAHAQDMGYDSSGGSYDMGYDSGSGSYNMGYDSSGSSNNVGYDSTGSSYNMGYDSGSSNNMGYDSGSTYSDFPSGCSTDCSTYSEFPSSYSEFPNTTYSEFPTTDCSSCVTESGVTYSEFPTTATESGYTTSSYSTPAVISAPASYGFSSGGYSTGGYSYGGGSTYIPSAPIVQNIPIAYQQQRQQQQIITPVVQPQPNIVTNNTCTNYSCNTVTNVSNSGNTVTTVVPVSQTPITYPVQYTFPTNYNYQNVSCTITASPNSIQSGQYTYLTWQSYGATSATLSSYGNVAPNGSLSVRPYGSMNYVLTVYGYNGQTATCNTYVNVGSYYPQTPSVTLSQIPYTGFDFGTTGDAMYWTMLVAFAFSAGYLLVYYKGGMAAFAGSMIPARKFALVARKTTVEKHVVAAAPVVEHKIETSVASTVAAKPAPVQTATIDSLPGFAHTRPTSDSMKVVTDGGAPRIVIARV
ncbi:MAG: hypothetical protein P4L81_03185 [Candidatus Pacebacteria bacterium]|nr:hypothetical protein [Candidatus Paceibacterota bacterium]